MSTTNPTASTRRRIQGTAGLGRAAPLQPTRDQAQANLPPAAILARYQPGKTDPMKVLEVHAVFSDHWPRISGLFVPT